MKFKVKDANAMNNGTSVIVTGELQSLVNANGRCVVEKLTDGRYRVTKLPKCLDAKTARILMLLRRHGPLLIVGDRLVARDTREIIEGTSAATARAARYVSICPLTATVTMTHRGEGFFCDQETVTVTVPRGMTGVVQEAVDYAINRHYQRS